MKKQYNFFALMILILIIGVGSNARGQGRGHHRGHEKNHDKHDHDKKDRDWDNNNRNRGDWNYDNDSRYRRNDRRSVQHVYHHRHDRYCGHSTVVVHNYSRPRYIYYRDYDVYYDFRNNVYISYSGRSWTVSAAIPVMMRQVNIRKAKRYEVDYWDDDFPRYLERRRPSHVREYYDW